MMSIDGLAQDVFDWADFTFPHRTLGSMALKLYEEIGEMLKDPHDHSEFADVMILLLDHAKIYEIDIEVAIRDKLAINGSRTWEINENGVMSHVRTNKTV